jgi:hypothetical protein
MTDDRSDRTDPLDEPLDDEFHSTLEVDDSSGWRVFIVPGVLLVLVLGAILFIVLSQGSDSEIDPRVAQRLKEKEAAENTPASPPAREIFGPTQPAAQPAENGAQPANAAEPKE